MPPLPALAPSASTMASGLGGAVAVILVYVLSLKGIFLPAGVEAAVAWVVSTVAGYIPRAGRLHS
jgi:hypothetical protein